MYLVVRKSNSGAAPEQMPWTFRGEPRAKASADREDAGHGDNAVE